MRIEKDAFLKDYASNLSMLSIDGKSVFIKDSDTNAIAEVVLSDNILYCMLDHAPECIHIQYALALAEFAELYRNRENVLPMIIKDDATKKYAKVAYSHSKLYCYLCQSDDCVHVEIAKMEVNLDRARKAAKEEKKQ